MKVLLLGASGMLGHRVYARLKSENIHVKATAQRSFLRFEKINLFRSEDLIENVDLTQSENYLKILDREQPDVIINCAGATTRKLNQYSTSDIINLNSVLPHRLNEWCKINKAKLIHISTDCVFHGEHPPYTENSPIEAQDIYGLSKALGEIKDSENALTLRTSIIGPELESKTELFEWILSQKNKSVKGYENVIYSGVTTIYLSDLIIKLLMTNSKLSGLYQISSDAISKLDLIRLVNKVFDLKINVIPDAAVKSDKTLSQKLFFERTKWPTPSWPEQIDKMKLVYETENQPTRPENANQ